MYSVDAMSRSGERRASGATFAEDEVWDWHEETTGRKVAYAELDATGVRQQGPHAERAEGRMPLGRRGIQSITDGSAAA